MCEAELAKKQPAYTVAVNQLNKYKLIEFIVCGKSLYN